MLAHIILGCLERAAIESLIEDKEYKETGLIDISVTVNGHEADLMNLVNNWQSQVERIITDECKKRIEANFSDLLTNKIEEAAELTEDLRSRLMEEVDSRMQDWER